MSTLFLIVLNRSIKAGWLILAVLLVRVLLKRAPKWIFCLLWGLVAVCLLFPFSLESVFSLIPSSETVPMDIALQAHPAIDSGIAIVDETVNPIIAGSFTPEPYNSVNPLQVIIPVVSIVWLIGTGIMMGYALISYLRLKKSVSASISLEKDVLASDEVKTPFILGIFRPVIYVPSSMNEETLKQVLTTGGSLSVSCCFLSAGSILSSGSPISFSAGTSRWPAMKESYAIWTGKL